MKSLNTSRPSLISATRKGAVYLAMVGRLRNRRSSIFFLNPTTGALEIRPDAYPKIEKALRRAARRIAFRLYLAQPRLYLEFLWLKGCGLRLDMVRYVLRLFHKSV